jgi:hypothetical protein
MLHAVLESASPNDASASRAHACASNSAASRRSAGLRSVGRPRQHANRAWAAPFTPRPDTHPIRAGARALRDDAWLRVQPAIVVFRDDRSIRVAQDQIGIARNRTRFDRVHARRIDDEIDLDTSERTELRVWTQPLGRDVRPVGWDLDVHLVIRTEGNAIVRTLGEVSEREAEADHQTLHGAALVAPESRMGAYPLGHAP